MPLPNPWPHNTHLENSDADGQQPNTDYFDQTFNPNPETQRPVEPITSGGLDGDTQASPEVENSGQAATLRQLDTGRNHQPMGHDHDIPVPTPQASLPLTAAPVEANADNGTTK